MIPKKLALKNCAKGLHAPFQIIGFLELDKNTKPPVHCTEGFSDSEGSRTPNLRIRSAVLYPVKLQSHPLKWAANILNAAQRVGQFREK